MVSDNKGEKKEKKKERKHQQKTTHVRYRRRRERAPQIHLRPHVRAPDATLAAQTSHTAGPVAPGHERWSTAAKRSARAAAVPLHRPSIPPEHAVLADGVVVDLVSFRHSDLTPEVAFVIAAVVFAGAIG